MREGGRQICVIRLDLRLKRSTDERGAGRGDEEEEEEDEEEGLFKADAVDHDLQAGALLE